MIFIFRMARVLERPTTRKLRMKNPRRQQHGVRKQRPGNLILLSIGCEQQRRDELGAEHPQKDPGGNGHQTHEEGFREEEPADGPLLHPHDGLEGKLPLFPAEHIVVDEADQKQQDQSDGADGQLLCRR